MVKVLSKIGKVGHGPRDYSTSPISGKEGLNEFVIEQSIRLGYSSGIFEIERLRDWEIKRLGDSSSSGQWSPG
jgi:hypothetical protein